MQHGTYDDVLAGAQPPPHLKNIKPAVMTVGGWFDAENLFGPLRHVQAIEKQNPGTANMLVMGPWYHGGWSAATATSLG